MRTISSSARPSPTLSSRPSTFRDGRPLPQIKLIATDVDGTLLNSQQQLTQRVENAINAAAAAGVPLIVATGKARGPWTQKVFSRVNMTLPGVFIQGLLVCDAEGRVLWQRHMAKELVQACVALADKYEITVTAYAGQRILAAVTNHQTDRLKFYGEPTVEAVGPLSAVAEETPIQKLIFMAEPAKLDVIRGELESAFSGQASLTVAIEGMLEVLPPDASKGAGLAWLLSHLGVDAANVLALGDGENDVEMLRLVGVGVAMGNAVPRARSAADFVVATNDEDGVAQAIEHFVLRPSEQ